MEGHRLGLRICNIANYTYKEVSVENTDLQKALKAIGYYKESIDGDIGPASRKAIDTLLEVKQVKDWKRWGEERRLLAAKQQICKDAGLEVGKVDGLIGPQTRYVFEVWNARKIGDKAAETWRDTETKDTLSPLPVPTTWPTQASVKKFYGEVGQNQAMVDLPYAMRIAWDRAKTVTRMSIHEKVADSALRVLNRVADAYTHTQRQQLGLDLFGGCLNVRKMRGGSSYSMHSWGIALDFDPERNQLKWGKDKAHLAKSDCELFWKLWEEEGWISLGRAKNYDWMHVQAARL